MTTIEAKAEAVRSRLNESATIHEAVGFDPAIIAVIIQVIQAILKAWQECKRPAAELPRMAEDPGILGRWHVRRAVRHVVNDNEMHDLVGRPMVNAVLAVGAETTADEAKAMAAEAGA